MKSKFKLTIVLILLTTIFAGASRAEFSKSTRKGWSKSGVTALQISNKYGEVKINDIGGDSVTIKVLITIENASSEHAKELMNKITVNFGKSGGTVSAETEIEDNFRNNESFSINYLVNIPKDRDLDISNKYGNVILNELEAKGNFEVSYGSMSAGKMKAPAGNPIQIIVNYGKADLESINDANIEIKYSKLNIGEISQLELESKYSSTINLHKVGNMTLDSKYDPIVIDEIGKLKSESRYSSYKIGRLTEDFDLNTGYGSVRIDKVDPKFNRIRIENSYGGINIGLNNLNYSLDADCDYCSVKYPEDRFKGNKMKDGTHFSLEGKVGTGGGTVNITSRYGGVKLEE